NVEDLARDERPGGDGGTPGEQVTTRGPAAKGWCQMSRPAAKRSPRATHLPAQAADRGGEG
ncbi:hypothetical protein, partial [Phytomonospora endophytica]|uniref:hypothetical protein n=1 Tax=Phytomonospora endophytica TaxID=714109 RepID=UPI001C8521A3